MSLSIARFITRCRIPRRVSDRGYHMDHIVRERFALECARQLAPLWPSHGGVCHIRRLPLRLTLSLEDLEAGRLPKVWVSAFARALFAAMARPAATVPNEVIRFENRAALLAKFVSDLLIGIASGKWEYEEFWELFGLGTVEAILALFDRERSEIVSTLLEMETAQTLGRLLALFDDVALERLFIAIGQGLGGAEAQLSVEELVTVGRILLSGANMAGRVKLASPRHALRLFLALVRERGMGSQLLSPRKVFHSLTALTALLDLTSRIEPLMWDSVLAAESLEELLGCRLPSSILALIAEVLDQARVTDSGLAIGSLEELLGRHIPLSLPAMIAKVRDLARMAGSELAARSLEEHLGGRLPPSVLAVIAEADKLAGRHASCEITQLLDALRPLVLSSTQGRDEPWVSSDCAGLFLLVSLLNRLGWPEIIRRSSVDVSLGPRAITYILAGLGLAVLGRFVDAPKQPEWPERIDPGLALFAGWLDEPHLAGLRSFLASGSPSMRSELLVALVRDTDLPNGCSDGWATTLDFLAAQVVRTFAGRVRGFKHASRPFVVKHFLALPGRIRVSGEQLTVVLPPSPFHVALHLSGMDDTTESVDWLGGRRVHFQLEGL